MEKIGIVTEIAADLTQELIDKHQIVAVSVNLDWPEIENLPGENTFQKTREAEKRGIKSFGKTSQPSPKAFLDAYRQQLERFEKVICVIITSKLSGTYNSAIQGRKFLPAEQQERIFIVDSLSASAGEGLLVLRTLNLIEKGKSVEEIVEDLEKLVPRLHAYIMLKDPKWLVASGRISSVVGGIMRNMAKVGIRPLLTFKEGLLVPAGIKTGAKDIPTALFKQFKKDAKKFVEKENRIRVVITHGDDPEGVHRLKDMIETEFKNAKIDFVNIIDDILAVLTGPDSIVCAWYEEL